MKVLVISQYFWPENFRINELVLELVRLNHKVTVLTGHSNFQISSVKTNKKFCISSIERFKGILVVRVLNTPRNKSPISIIINYIAFAMSASTIGLWLLREKKFDKIFVFQPSPVTVTIPGIILKLYFNIPAIIWILDLWPQTIYGVFKFRSTLIKKALARICSFLYGKFDLVLTQSEGILNEMRLNMNVKSEIQYFPNWAEKIFENDKLFENNKYSPRRGAFNVMFAGNIGDAQDFETILSACEELHSYPGIIFTIVGDGRKYDWLKLQVCKRQLHNKFFLVGRFSNEEMPQIYKSASALLVTLKKSDIFSITVPGRLQNCLITGLPLIGALDGQGAKIINDSGAGLVSDAGDYKALASNILAMSNLSNKELLQMGRNGIRYCTEHFDRSRLMSRLNYLLCKL